MKKIASKFVLIILIVTFISCDKNNKITNPNEIGQQVFNVLQNLQSTTKEDFQEYFLEIDQIRGLARDDRFELTENFKNELTSVSKEDYQNIISEKYNTLKESAIFNEITLKDINYLDFIYKTKISDGLTIIEGTLYFKYKNKTYFTESEHVHLIDQFTPVEFGQIMERD